MRKFQNQIICGDCIELLGGVKEPFADLVFADPPFNIGYQYDQYKDTLKKDKYIHWTRDWMGACVNILKSTGSFYVAIGDDYAAHVRIIGEELGLACRNWIIWHYTFGQQTKNKFARAHTHLFYFVKDAKQFTFNEHAVRLPSDRQLIYNDKRANAAGKMPDDVWNSYSRVCGTFKERQGWHPCQMPELLLARIIATSSNVGDLILDPFSGSGTTAAAAMQLGRDYCGIDVSDNYVENTKKRLAELKTNPSNSRGLTGQEYLEFKRLFTEMGFGAETIIENEKLLNIFTRQYHLRMNNGKKYDTVLIQNALKDFVTWGKKR
ncbi:MAG: site-specific DNA-methyltransferase [Planctomycetes bacterium]|nr:site-specific DNA-methyltransferase [Planctomycetota bacterium]